ncbi:MULTISPECIES: hypothetical protein [unclassified Microcoleus]
MHQIGKARTVLSIFPKFNVVPPGVNESVYFPYTRIEDRVQGDRDRPGELLFTLEDPEQVFG